MSVTALLLALALAAYLYQRRRSRQPGAGASAGARARQLRTPVTRLADLFGIDTARSRHAARWRVGREGERRTARLLRPLEREGWALLHDRALPTGMANVDHLALSPSSAVFLLDTKLWSARRRLRAVHGRLLHGTHDVTGRLDGLLHEQRSVAAALGVPVIPIVIMHGAPIENGELRIHGVQIIPAERCTDALRRIERRSPGPRVRPADLTARAEHLFPPYSTTR